MDIDETLLMGTARTDPIGEEADRMSPSALAPGFESFDIDGDGYRESRVVHTEAGMTVARDRDEDGVIDTFTSIGREGHYESWEIFRAIDGSARWARTGSGEVFD